MSDAVNLHGTAVCIAGKGILITGASGTGKSDLALRLIDRGAQLVSDDRVVLQNNAVMKAPDSLAGRMEVRHIGIMTFPYVSAVLKLIVDLDREPERLPLMSVTRNLSGVEVPVIALRGIESSAPVKVELAVQSQTGEDTVYV